jgi:hypothetical protein
MCKENKSCSIIAHHAYVHMNALGTIRAPESKSVPLHRASRHVGTDIRSNASLDGNIKVLDACFVHGIVQRYLFDLPTLFGPYPKEKCVPGRCFPVLRAELLKSASRSLVGIR